MTISKEDERTPGRDDDETLVHRWFEWAKTARKGGPIVVDRSILLRGIGVLENAYTSTDALRSALAEAQERARKAENALFQFNYPPDPKMLREVADEIDCGQTCEFGNIEWDTGAHNCSKRDREGCPGDNAIQLREFADAIEAAGSKPTPEPSLDECDELAQTLLGGSEPLMRPLSVRSHPHETRAALSGSPAPDNDLANRVRAHVERLANTDMQLPLDEWCGISNDILRCADAMASGRPSISGSPAPSTEGLRAALAWLADAVETERRTYEDHRRLFDPEGPIPADKVVARTGDAFDAAYARTNEAVKQARNALAGVTAPSEVDGNKGGSDAIEA